MYPTTRSYTSFRQSGLGPSSTVYYLLIDGPNFALVDKGNIMQYHTYIVSIYIVHHISHKSIRIIHIYRFKRPSLKNITRCKTPVFFQPPQSVKEKHTDEAFASHQPPPPWKTLGNSEVTPPLCIVAISSATASLNGSGSPPLEHLDVVPVVFFCLNMAFARWNVGSDINEYTKHEYQPGTLNNNFEWNVW